MSFQSDIIFVQLVLGQYAVLIAVPIRVSSTEIKPGAFIFVVFFGGTSPAAHCSSESPKQIRMAQLPLPRLSL